MNVALTAGSGLVFVPRFNCNLKGGTRPHMSSNIMRANEFEPQKLTDHELHPTCRTKCAKHVGSTWLIQPRHVQHDCAQGFTTSVTNNKEAPGSITGCQLQRRFLFPILHSFSGLLMCLSIVTTFAKKLVFPT